MLSLAEHRRPTGVRNIIQQLTLTCASKKTFNCAQWPSNSLSNKCNVPEAVEKRDNHAFFYIGYFFLSCFVVFLLFF